MKDDVKLHIRLEEARKFSIDLSKTAGITKGLKYLIDSSSDAEQRYYFKSLFEAQFKQLMIGLTILTQDADSQIRIEKILKDFEKLYGGRLKELGLNEDIKRETKYAEELKSSIEKWGDLRNNYAAHLNIEKTPEFNIGIDEISIFIEVIGKILNTLITTTKVPSYYPRHIDNVSYSMTSAINLEEESFNAIKENLKWLK